MNKFLSRTLNVSFQYRCLSPTLVLFLLLAACSPAAPARPTPTTLAFPLSPCQLYGPGGAVNNGASCGTLEVLENPAGTDGRMLSLRIAILKASSRSPEPDPVFLLAGGPGQAATEAFTPVLGAFSRINQKRDLVMVDQRGTGELNQLVCPSPPEEADIEQELGAWVEACLAELEVDPRLFTTANSVEDLEQARQQLGYHQINLYGVSYGTRLALAYLERYPQNVRSLILDGIVPQQEPLGLNVARDAQRALEQVFERCAGDPACSQAFPDLRQTFQDLMAELSENPVEVTLPHPTSGNIETVQFDREKLGDTIRLLSYAPETAALLPLLISHAHRQDDYSRLAAQYLLVSGQLEESLNPVLGYSVLCTEDAPYMTPDQARQANTGAYLGDSQSSAIFEVCKYWPRAEVQQPGLQPVLSDTPALLLSGEADPVTPPEYGEQAARSLSRSRHLVVPGQGHNVIYRGCLPFVAGRFLDQPESRELDTSCVEHISAMPFFLSFAGPAP